MFPTFGERSKRFAAAFLDNLNIIRQYQVVLRICAPEKRHTPICILQLQIYISLFCTGTLLGISTNLTVYDLLRAGLVSFGTSIYYLYSKPNLLFTWQRPSPDPLK